jgi:hypothetical protein
MRLRRRDRSASEIGWISTTDFFILASCFFLIVATSANRERKAKTELAEKLGVESKESSDALQQLRLQLGDARTLENRRKAEAEIVDKEKKLLQEAAVRIKDQEVKLAADLKGITEERQRLGQQLIEAGSRETALKHELAQAVDERDRVAGEKSAIDATLQRQKQLNNELLGLGGQLKHVVFMVDISGSMKGGLDAENGDSYWKQTQTIIKRWINNLDVGSVAIIFFGDQADVVAEMHELDAAHRQKIGDILDRADPDAKATNFLAAFKRAYELPVVDTIIVFSDGLPSVDINGKVILPPQGRQAGESEAAFARRREADIEQNVTKVLEVHQAISAMAKGRPEIAINAIGLGNKVYTPQTGNLLNELALRNRGVFIAISATDAPGPKLP